MSEKYELFLDKNKKVKLSADEQGNFFAEANGKKIKLGSEGLQAIDELGGAAAIGGGLSEEEINGLIDAAAPAPDEWHFSGVYNTPNGTKQYPIGEAILKAKEIAGITIGVPFWLDIKVSGNYAYYDFETGAYFTGQTSFYLGSILEMNRAGSYTDAGWNGNRYVFKGVDYMSIINSGWNSSVLGNAWSYEGVINSTTETTTAGFFFDVFLDGYPTTWNINCKLSKI